VRDPVRRDQGGGGHPSGRQEGQDVRRWIAEGHHGRCGGPVPAHGGHEEVAPVGDVPQEVQRQGWLMVDTRKWLLSKMFPKKYGDKVSAEVSGPDGGPIREALIVEYVRPKD